MLKESNSDIVNKYDIANAMKAYFCSVGKDLASKIETVPNPMIAGKFNLNYHSKHFYFKTIAVQDTREAMVKIKTSNSFGCDKISCYFLKLAFPSIKRSLAFIFNTSLETSYVPDLWKNARITPTFKDGDKTE